MKKLVLAGFFICFVSNVNAGTFINPNISQHIAKTQSIKGKIEYGCGGSSGTYCYIITTNKNQSYIIDYGRNLEIQQIDFLNQLVDFQSCAIVKGVVLNKKVGLFKQFNPNKAIEIMPCK